MEKETVYQIRNELMCFDLEEKKSKRCEYILTRGYDIHTPCYNRTINGATFCDFHLQILARRKSTLLSNQDDVRFAELCFEKQTTR